VQHVRNRARAVIAAGDERAVAAAPDVGQAGDPVGGGDHRADPAGRAGTGTGAGAGSSGRLMLRSQVALVQHRAGADAERAAGVRSRDAVGRQAVCVLEALQGARGLGAEDTVGAQAKGLLQRADAAVADARVRARAAGCDHRLDVVPAGGRLRLRLGDVRAQRRPGGLADHRVGLQAVGRLERLQRLDGLRPEHAVGLDAECLLHLGHAAHQDLRARRLRPGGGVGLRVEAGEEGGALGDRAGTAALSRGRGGALRALLRRRSRGRPGMTAAAGQLVPDREGERAGAGDAGGHGGDRELARGRLGHRDELVGDAPAGEGEVARLLEDALLGEVARAAQTGQLDGGAPGPAAAGEGALEGGRPDVRRREVALGVSFDHSLFALLSCEPAR